MGDGNFKWWYRPAGGDDDDPFYGPYDTLEQATAAAMAEPDVGAVELIEADKMLPDFNCVDADYIIDSFILHNEECWNEDGECFTVDPTSEQKDKLAKDMMQILENWFKENNLGPRVWSFDTIRNKQIVEVRNEVKSNTVGD